jgi:hypothetical protein
MADASTATLYAADHVYSEIYEHLPKIERWSKVPLVVLRSRFEKEYLPALRFVTVDSTEIVDPQVLAITDADDRPTGLLAKLIAPCVVFSEDKHLRLPGLAPEDWLSVAQFAIDLVEGATGQRIPVTAATLPVSSAIELIKLVGRRTGVPPWLIGGVVVGAFALAVRSPERRQAIGKYVMPVVEAYSKRFQQAMAQEQHGLDGLREVLLAAPAAPTVKQQTAIVLARQSEALLAREIQERIQRHFLAELVPTVAEVRAVLKDGSEFVQPERYRWQFGREAGAWRGPNLT